MWIAELSRQTEVPVATIKYYLREGLLPAGEAVGATRSRYDEAHVRRLRLVRALVEAGGLSLSQVHGVLTAVDEESREMHEVLGSAHSALLPEKLEATPESLDRVGKLIADQDWQVEAGSRDRTLLANALDSLDRVDYDLDADLLNTYAAAAGQIGAADVAHLPTNDRAQAVESTVIITALGGPLLLALRRLAQQSASARRYGTQRESTCGAPDVSAP